MKSWLIGIAIGVALAILLVTSPQLFRKTQSDSEWLTAYSQLEVGSQIPQWTGGCAESVIFGPTTPSGKFHVHLVGNFEITCCYDSSCPQSTADKVNERGGHMHISTDLKLAKTLGIPIVNDGNEWRSAENLMIINDEQGKIISIVRHAKLEDVAKGLVRARLQ